MIPILYISILIFQWQTLVNSAQYRPPSKRTFLNKILDDEDIVGSGEEGSGHLLSENEFIIYRCRIKLIDVTYDRSYSDRENTNFKELSKGLTQQFLKLFPSDWQNELKISVVQIRPSSDINAIASLDISASELVSNKELTNIIWDAVKSSYIGTYRVSPEEFSFTALSAIKDDYQLKIFYSYYDDHLHIKSIMLDSYDRVVFSIPYKAYMTTLQTSYSVGGIDTKIIFAHI
ncbi:unnamed protein product [Gordionus sp. m RMFG-2023]